MSWSVRSCTNVSGLVLELMLRTIMEIRARPSSLAAMPRRAIWVISSRMRWKDHFSISSFLSQTSVGKKDRGAYMELLLVVISFLGGLTDGCFFVLPHAAWGAGLVGLTSKLRPP